MAARSATWPRGEGEMAGRVRAHDWGATPLGPVEGWPEGLRAVADLVLASPLLSTLAVGPERVLLYNDAAARLYGERHPGALGRPLPETWPEAYAVAAHLYERAFAGEAVQVPAQPLDVSEKGGEVFDVTLTPVRDEGGAVVAVHMTGFEIGARFRAEAALRASEALFRHFAEASTGILWIRGVEGLRLDYASPAFGAAYGLDPAGFGAQGDLGHWVAVLHPDDREGVLDAFRRVSAGERVTHEFRMLRRDGEARWIRNTDFPLLDEQGRVERIGGIGEDVTELKQAQAAVAESEQRLRGFAEASADVLWIVDAATRRLEYLSPAYEEVWGEERGRVMADLGRWAEMILPEDLAQTGGALDAALSGRRATVEYRIRRPDGTLRHVRDTGFPIFGLDGQVRRAAGVAQDVTERRRAELAFERSQSRFRHLLEGIPQLVWRAVDGGDWTWASPQWEIYTGQSSRDSQGRGWLDALHPDDRDRAMAAWDEAVASGVLAVEYRVREAATGEHRWFQTRATPVRDAAGRIVEWLGSSTDVQDLKEFQERQEVLVAELQHRTRNLITVVRSIARQTMASTGPTEAFREAFDSRLEALSRVQGLLSRAEQEPITLRALLALELEALGATQGERVTLDGPPVRLRPTIVQTLALALHELATNARKYGALSDGGGRLDVRWRLRNGDEGRRIHIEWREEDLPGVAAVAPPSPERQGGYGRQLIERALPYALRAQTTYELGPAGLRCTIDLPLDRPGPPGST